MQKQLSQPLVASAALESLDAKIESHFGANHIDAISDAVTTKLKRFFEPTREDPVHAVALGRIEDQIDACKCSLDSLEIAWRTALLPRQLQTALGEPQGDHQRPTAPFLHDVRRSVSGNVIPTRIGLATGTTCATCGYCDGCRAWPLERGSRLLTGIGAPTRRALSA